MKLQYGEQVAEYRSKHRIEVVLPADAPNVSYAVTQLCGGDPDVKPKIVVQAEVFLTEEQLRKLRNLTDLELLAIRNSVNPTTILSARLLEEPAEKPITSEAPTRQQAAQVELSQRLKSRVYLLKMETTLSPGLWVLMRSPEQHEIVEIRETKPLSAAIPAAMISGPVSVQVPIEYRKPCMPKDYGKTVYCMDFEEPLESFTCLKGVLQGYDPVRKCFMVQTEARSPSIFREQMTWIVVEPTDGF